MAWNKNSAKAQAWREQRDAKIKELQSQLETKVNNLGNSAEWLNMLKFMRMFHKYSLKNQMLLAIQYRGEATMVAGFSQWKQRGRMVRKGEKSAVVMAPFTYVVKDEDGKPKLDDNGEKIRKTYFKFVRVFDIKQTDPIDPSQDITETLRKYDGNMVGEDVTGVYERVESWLKNEGWTVELQKLRSGLHGYTQAEKKLIVVSAQDGDAMRAATLVHEAGHAMLETRLNDKAHVGNGYQLHRGLAETEAESIAYVVGGLLGLDTSDTSVTYVAGWSEMKPDILKEAAENVRKAVNIIMDGLETVQAA